MAIVKGYCKYCDTSNEKNRIFNVHTTAQVCYCPRCMTEMSPDEAIDELDKVFRQKMLDANKLMCSKNEYLEAYEAYGSIIETDDTYYRARFGRLLALLYMSTLRTSTLNSFAILLKEEGSAHFKSRKIFDNYIIFLRLANNSLDEYMNGVYKALTFRKYFYDADCLMLFGKRLREVLRVKEAVLKEVETMKVTRSEDASWLALKDAIEKSIEKINKDYASTYSIAEGYKYTFVDVLPDDNPVLGTDHVKRLTTVGKYVLATLAKKDKEKRIIPDAIFSDNRKRNASISRTFPISILCGLGGVLFLVFTLLNLKYSFFTIPVVKNIPFMVASGILFSLSVLYFILHFVWKTKLKGNEAYKANPFLFK